MQHAGLNKWPCSDEKAAYSGMRVHGARRPTAFFRRTSFPIYLGSPGLLARSCRTLGGFRLIRPPAAELVSPFWISNQVTNAATLYAVNWSGVSK